MKRFLRACLLVSALSFFYIIYSEVSRARATAPVSVSVDKGEGVQTIAKKLYEKDVIFSPFLFKAWAILSGSSLNLKPGRYEFSERPSVFRVIRELRDGPVQTPFTIIPGETIREIEDNLAQDGLASPGDLRNLSLESFREKYPWLNDSLPLDSSASLEGFLLPDTYHFYAGQTAEDMVSVILDNFREKALPKIRSRDSILRILTTASLLEKEVRESYDGEVVAGILAKRDAAGIPLQVDATVTYVSCRGKYHGCTPLRASDYRRESPYNTYAMRGFPPGPIASPSIKTIETAQSARETDYWYYLTDPKTKKTIFSKTFDEHQRNRAIYLLK